jgi:hypothetical protein
MQVLTNGKIETKPTSYSLIINNNDETGTLDLRIKVNRQTLQKFASVMPLLIPEARRTFDRLSFWLDVPVDINYYSRDDEFELGAKKMCFKVNGEDMLCFVPGYHRAIGIKVAQFVEMVNGLYETIEGSCFEPLKTTMASGNSSSGVKTFRAVGIRVPNLYMPYVMAAYDDTMCVVAYCGYMPDCKRYTRAVGGHAKYFTRDDENGWVMNNHVPFINRNLVEAANAFNIY